MTSVEAISLAPAPTKKTTRIPWPLLLLTAVCLALIVDRYHYLTHFGFLYTDADQATLWYQADDISRGLFREPCFYGQTYNVALEAFLAAPLLLLHIPAYIALPLVTAVLTLLPFFLLAIFAYRHNQRWIAAILLLLPLIFPTEYLVVSSLPRGFVTGLALAAPTVCCWLFGNSKKAFFFGSFFAVLSLTTNPNGSIVLLAAGLYALLTHYRSLRLYLFSFFGTLTALPVPFLIWLFYLYHPETDAYSPKVGLAFHWNLLKQTVLVGGALNHRRLDQFFADFIPIVRQGWIVLLVFPILVVLLLLLRQWKSAIAILLASTFAIACLGIEAIHSSFSNVFYPGSRMFLALPVLFAIALLWLDAGLSARFQKWRFVPVLYRGTLLLACIIFACSRNLAALEPPSDYFTEASVPPVATVKDLRHDTDVISAVCKKNDAHMVLIPYGFNCFGEPGPVLSHRVFETICPPWERRTFLITQEKTVKRSKILLYEPNFFQMAAAQNQFKTTLVANSPRLLLIDTSAKSMSVMDVAAALGIAYRPHF